MPVKSWTLLGTAFKLHSEKQTLSNSRKSDLFSRIAVPKKAKKEEFIMLSGMTHMMTNQ